MTAYKRDYDFAFYASVEEMMDDADRRAHFAKHLFFDADGAYTFPMSVSQAHWTGRNARTWAEFRKGASKPWAEGLEMLEALIGKLGDVQLPTPRSIKRKKSWNADDGDDVDLDRMWAGQEYWQKTSRQALSGSPIVTIVCNVSASSTYDTTSLFWKGAAAIALADILERAGYRVNVLVGDYGAAAYRGHPADSFRLATVKPPESPVDKATLANVLSGWFFRTVFFRITASPHSSIDRRIATPAPMTAEEITQETGLQNPVIFQNFFTLAQAEEHLRMALASFK